MSDDDYVQVDGEEDSNATGYEDEDVGEELEEDEEEEEEAEEDEHDLVIEDVEIDDENLELPVFTEEGMLALKRGYFIGSQQSLLNHFSINSEKFSPVSFLAFEREYGLTVLLGKSSNAHVYRTQDIEDAVYPVGMELLKSTPVDQKDSAVEPKPFIVLQNPQQEPFINAAICHTRVACLARSKALHLFDLQSAALSADGVRTCLPIRNFDGVDRFMLGRESVLYIKVSEPNKLYSRPLLNLASNEKVVYTESAGRISAFALSLDGLYVLISTEAPTLVVVSLVDGRSQVLLDLQEICDAVYWPKKDTIILAESSGSIVVYSAADGESGLIDGEIDGGWRLFDPCDTPRPLPSWQCSWFFDYFEPWDAFIVSNSHSSKASVIGKWTEESVDEETGNEYIEFGWYAYSIAYNAAGETTKRLEIIDDRRLFSLADRPITFLGASNEVDDRVYVCGIKWMTSSSKSIPPAFVLGSNRELEGVPDFPPAPTLLIQSSTGLVHATALVDLNNEARHLLAFDPIKELHFHPSSADQIQPQPSSVSTPTAVSSVQPTPVLTASSASQTSGLFSQPAATSTGAKPSSLFGQSSSIGAPSGGQFNQPAPGNPGGATASSPQTIGLFGQSSSASTAPAPTGLFSQPSSSSIGSASSTSLFGQNLLGQQTASSASSAQPVARPQPLQPAPPSQPRPLFGLGMVPTIAETVTGTPMKANQNTASASLSNPLLNLGTTSKTPGEDVPPMSETRPASTSNAQQAQPPLSSTGGQGTWWPFLKQINADKEQLKEERKALDDERKIFEHQRDALMAFDQARKASPLPNWRIKLSGPNTSRPSNIQSPPQRKKSEKTESGAQEKAFLRFVEELDADMMFRSRGLGNYFKDDPDLESFFVERQFDAMLTETHTSLSETARLKESIEELNRLIDDLDDKNVYTMFTTESARLINQRRNGRDANGLEQSADSVASAESSADRALTQRLQGLILREEQVLSKYKLMESFLRTQLETLEQIHREEWMRLRAEEGSRFEEDVLNRINVLCTKAKTTESRIEMLIRRASRRTGQRDLARSISAAGAERPAHRTRASDRGEAKFRSDFSSFAECDRTTPIQVETLNTGFFQQLNKDFDSVKQEDDIRQKFNSDLSEKIKRTKQKLNEAKAKNIITPAKPAGPILSKPPTHSAGSMRMPPEASTFRSFGQQQPSAGDDHSLKKKSGDDAEEVEVTSGHGSGPGPHPGRGGGRILQSTPGSKASGGFFGAGTSSAGGENPPPPPPLPPSEKPGGLSMAGFGGGLQQQQTPSATTGFGGGAASTTTAPSVFGGGVGGGASGDASKIIKEAVKAFYSVVKPDKANDAEVEGLYSKYSDKLVSTLQSKYRTSTEPRVQEALTKLVQSTQSVGGLLMTSPPRPSGFAGTTLTTPGIFGGASATGGGFSGGVATTPGPTFGGTGFGGVGAAASTPALGATGFGGMGGAASTPSSTMGWGTAAPSSIGGGFSSSAHERALRAFYERANPTKVNDVPATLAKYKGKEMAMWETLKQKYSQSAPFIDQLLRETGISGGSATPGGGLAGGGGFASAMSGGTPAFGGASPGGFGASAIGGGGFGASAFGGNPSASPGTGGAGAFQGGFGQPSFGTPGGASGFGAAAGSGNVFGGASGSGFGGLAGGNVFGGDAGAFSGGGGGGAFSGGGGGFGGTPGGSSFSKIRG